MVGQKEIAIELRQLVARLNQDLKHLVWRAGVHTMSPEEIQRRYDQILYEYTQISTEEQLMLLSREWASWEPEIRKLMNAHRVYRR